MRQPRIGAPLLAIAILGGCATSASFGRDAANGLEPAAHARVTLRGEAILPAEIRAASTQTAYDAVLKLRPGFFTRDHSVRSGRAPAQPGVVLERGLPESLDVLRLVRSDQVAEIMFIEANEATVRYGPTYTAGVIVVRLAPDGL